jgi:TPR repeat protein
MKPRHSSIHFCLPICLLVGLATAVPAAEPAPSPPTTAGEAASADDAEQLFQSARKLLRGDGVEKDERKGFELMSQAAEKRHVQAMANLGFLYSAGIGTPVDHSAAAQWFRLASEQNHAVSQLNLARLLLAVDKLPAPANKAEEQARWDEGAMWLKKSADQGLSDAQSSYGLLLLRGDAGLESNPAEAARYLKPAVEAGIPEAMNALAMMHQIGNGVPTDTAETERLYRMASMAGNAKAQANFALFLENKAPGDPATQVEALAWLIIAEIGREPIAVKYLPTRLSVRNPDQVAAARKKSGELRRQIHHNQMQKNPGK